MATTIRVLGPVKWSKKADDDGHRNYALTLQVEAPVRTGPSAIEAAVNALYPPGGPWSLFGETDPEAYRTAGASVDPVVERKPPSNWYVGLGYTTRQTRGNSERCSDAQVGNPLLEPVKISGSFVKYVEEATHDMFGRALFNSAWEQLRGPQVEFDNNRPQVHIGMNVSALNLALIARVVDCVNNAPMWGMPARCVKLSDFSWERRFYGACLIYYSVNLTFDIRFESFDRLVLDEATKVLNGHWHPVTGEWILDDINGAPPNRMDPSHFIRFPDRQGNPMLGILNGLGEPYVPPTNFESKFYDSGHGRDVSDVTTPPAANTAGVPAPTGLAAALVKGGVLAEGNEYRYVVTAVTALGETTASDEVVVLPDADNHTAALTWNQSPRALSYRIYRIAAAADLNFNKLTSFNLIGAVTAGNQAGRLFVAKYPGVNFTLLGIPAVL